MTGSKVHNIGDQVVSPTNPLFGMQRGRAISYINGASGTISGNQVYDFQKSGIEVSGGTVDGGNVVASPTTSASVTNNTVTGAGPNDVIAQNGVVIRSGANATVNKNTVSKLWYNPESTESAGVFLLGPAGSTSRTTRSPPWRCPSSTAATREATSGRNLRPHNTDRGLHMEAPVFLRPTGTAAPGCRFFSWGTSTKSAALSISLPERRQRLSPLIGRWRGLSAASGSHPLLPGRPCAVASLRGPRARRATTCTSAASSPGHSGGHPSGPRQ